MPQHSLYWSSLSEMWGPAKGIDVNSQKRLSAIGARADAEGRGLSEADIAKVKEMLR